LKNRLLRFGLNKIFEPQWGLQSAKPARTQVTLSISVQPL